MHDGVVLFHSNRGHLAATRNSLDADLLGRDRFLLRGQTAVGGGVLNLAPRFLLASSEHEQDTETLLAASVRAISQVRTTRWCSPGCPSSTS